MDDKKVSIGNTLSMTNKQFVFLAALLGEEVVLGVEDPFLGWLAEQVEEEWKQTSLQMFHNGWIQIEEEGMFGVIPSLATYVRLCCAPEIWTSVTTIGNNEKSSHFMLNLNLENKQFALVSKNSLDESIELSFGQYEQDALQMVYNSLQNGENYIDDGFGIDLSEKVFKAFTEVSVEESLSRLEELDEAQRVELQNFINDLKTQKKRKLIHMGSMNSNSSQLMSIVLVEGENRLWRLGYYEIQNKPMVSIRQSDERDCLSVLESSLKQLV